MTVHHRLVEPVKPGAQTPEKIIFDALKDQTFDYIIVGGGTAGCLLASRLAASPTAPLVLVVEAGGDSDEDAENLIPALTVPKFAHEAGNWLYQTTSQKELNGRTIVYPRGRGLGGCSANNLSSWVRGPKCDFDEWAAITGDDWWKWENAVEYMKKLEDFHPEVPRGMEKYVRFTEAFHHQGGPIGVGTGAEWQDLIEYYLKGAMEAGHELNLDHNDGDEMGISVAQMNVDRGVRRNAADAFLGPASRSRLWNLSIVTKALCKRVLFDGRKAVGVELLPSQPNGELPDSPITVHAAKEVILSAGTLATPHILLLSGVGPKGDLTKHNIDVVLDQPYVGKNIRDHCAFSIEAVVDPSIPGHNQLLQSPSAMAAAKKQYEESRTGPLAVFGASAAMLFTRIPALYLSPEFQALPSEVQSFLAHPGRPSTELWLHGGPLFYSGKVDADDSVLAIEGLCQNLLSCGTLQLRSADPRELPVIDPAYVTEPYDWRVAIETIKVQLGIVNSPTMKSILRKVLHGPGERGPDGAIELCAPEDEDAIKKFLREQLTQGFHSMGSCAMGNEGNKERVVDAEFRVEGLEGLRVADMSSCPILTNNHTQINAYLIAERCAQVLLGEHGVAGDR